jgi:hypothetical protein
VSDEYLWDRSGQVDPDVERLETLLRPLRSAPPVPRLPRRRPRFRATRLAVPLLAAAALFLVAVVWRATLRPQTVASWEVTSLAGRPRIGASGVGADARLRVGDTLVTDAVSRARISSREVGAVMVDPGSRVRLVAIGNGRHRLGLERGSLQAFIVAPPGRFVVDTRSATAVDLGCVYTLSATEEGDGMLSVQAGWVGFQFNGRESFVPAGASCRTSAGIGPGTPRYDDADGDFSRALDVLDRAPAASPLRPAALRTVVEKARPRDAFTLWHLLARVEPAERETVFATLAALVPPPDGVTREAALRLDPSALDRWWDALGLGDTSLWRAFEQR